MIDRIAPTIRPSGRADGTQRWESLLFCHWELPSDALRSVLPGQLEMDTFEGRAFVGVVPFKMRRIKPRWLPQAFAFNFYETNVRTYVVHRGRPGVYFFSLDASSRLAVWAARAGWALPYFYSKMNDLRDGDHATYWSERASSGSSATHSVSYSVGEEFGESQPGTLEHFLLERYLLFVERRETIHVGHVHHRPYFVKRATVLKIQDGLIAASGLPATGKHPDLAHYCDGVDVEVFGIRPDV
ncbi:hypothetical protein CA13_61440 [Planctomycetes bacterium CA13]|uniref:DUF2071 domain-containing protein n=1 Tax=Novipirellula herctigrandis TaxID=2527986 RepID=A0A5C5ZBI2_9BACT|nr:hypothetical protein CA13_61440 [Planctomycetes bacterium CA13]